MQYAIFFNDLLPYPGAYAPTGPAAPAQAPAPGAAPTPGETPSAVPRTADLSPQFLAKTQRVASSVGARPEDLLRVMAFETGGVLRRANPIGPAQAAQASFSLRSGRHAA